MRRIILGATLVLVPLAAFAQTYPPGPPSSRAPAPSYYANNPSDNPPSSQSAMARPDPENCGTPDQPKACPPMPRRPLAYYPENRQ